MDVIKLNIESGKNKNQSLTSRLSAIEEIAQYGAMKQKILNKNLEDYIAKHEAKLIADLRKKLEEERSEKQTRLLDEEKMRRQQLHYMKCPQCGMGLQEVQFINTGVWICEECTGIWLKQGRLENIMKEQGSFINKMCDKIGLTKLMYRLTRR